MIKHKNGILLAATKNSAFTIGTLLINIQDLMKEKIDIFYIFHDGFNKNDINLMQNITNQKAKFILFDKEIFLKKFKNINTFFINRWTHMAYARFEALKLLNECENIIYLDFDILILKDISELFELKNQDYALAARKGKTFLKDTINLKNQKFINETIYQAGIIVFNDNIKNPLGCYDFLYSVENINDQGSFSLMVYEKNIKTKDLKDKYTGSVYWRKSKDASIIHAWGSNNRFWNNALCAKTWPKWHEYYQKWISLGGSSYKDGIKANTTHSYERIRFHLSYKLGYALIKYSKTFKDKIKLPLILYKISKEHKQEQKTYFKHIKNNPHLKLIPLKNYDDYYTQEKEYKSMPYKLGKALINAHKNWKKGGYFKLIKEISIIKKEYKNKII